MSELLELHLGEYRLGILLFMFSLITLEILISWRSGLRNYNTKETVANIAIFIGLHVSKFVFAAYQLWVLSFMYAVAPIKIESSLANAFVAFIVVDFVIYWYHRFSHKLKFLWAFHLVHHSSPWMNLTTAYRLNWLGGLILPFIFMPLMLLGFSPPLIALCVTFNLLYQFFLHTELVSRLGFLEIIFNTPSHHRVHHGSNPLYLDKNFGGVLIIWDRLFGTYQEEIEKPIYGITTGFVSHNPFILVFHSFIDLCKGQLRSKG